MMNPQPEWMQRLYQSLLPYPGRGNQVLRTVVSCVLVIIISQTLQVPWLSLSVLIVFFVTQTNVVFTRLTGFLFIGAASLAILISLLILIVTWNVPLLRILFSSLILLASVFLMRTAKAGVVFFVVAIVVIYAQTLVDIAPGAEDLIRAILWVWVAGVYSIAVTLIVNTLLMPVEPEKQLRDAMLRQLSAIADALLPAEGRALSHQDAVSIGINFQAMYKYLRFSVMRNTSGAFNEKQYLETITVISELRALAAQLPETLTNPQDIRAAVALRTCIADFHHAVESGSREPVSPPVWLVTDNPLLLEIAQVLRTFLRERPDTAEDDTPVAPAVKSGFLVADAFTNSKYIVFSLKTTLTVLLSYLFYTAADWTGIHTIMISCLIVAQPGLGNIQRKIILRLGGAAVGTLLALFAIVIVMPQLNSLFGLLMLVIPVLLLASWVATGPESISYAGIQIAFTFALATLESFGPVYELTEVRDRIVGIVAGILFAGLVHAFIAPEREGSVVMDKLASLLDTVREKWRLSLSASRTARAGVLMEIAECGDLISRVALEPSWSGTEGAHDALYQRSQDVFMVTKSLIFSTDRVAQQYRRTDKTLSAIQRESVIQLLNVCERNIQIASDSLRGRLTEEAKYPAVPAWLNHDFRLALQDLQQSTEQFFRIIRGPVS